MNDDPERIDRQDASEITESKWTVPGFTLADLDKLIDAIDAEGDDD